MVGLTAPVSAVTLTDTQGREATVELIVVITMDTRKKYVELENVYEVLSNETIQISAAESGKRRTFDFTSKTVTFDTARDTRNVGEEVCPGAPGEFVRSRTFRPYGR